MEERGSPPEGSTAESLLDSLIKMRAVQFCIGLGVDPHRHGVWQGADGTRHTGPRWLAYVSTAKASLANAPGTSELMDRRWEG